MDCRISIIIPTLNEREHILRLVHSLQGLEEIEIIVADGGSTDETYRLLEGVCKVVHSERGRANQMNAGAREATGNLLWFLHADSTISKMMPDEICNAMKVENVIGGGFPLQFDDPSQLLKWFAALSNWKAKWFQIFFGDQGFFIRRTVFDELGGFPSGR